MYRKFVRQSVLVPGRSVCTTRGVKETGGLNAIAQQIKVAGLAV